MQTMLKIKSFFPIVLITLLAITACASSEPAAVSAPAPQETSSIPVHLESVPFNKGACSGTFVNRPLNFTTTITAEAVEMFDSNGSGLGVNDLDNDGDLDIVLANLKGNNTVFWNEGDLNFTQLNIPHGQSRSVSIVDVNGDGWQDIIFTRQWSGPTYWQNNEGTFSQEFLPDITKQAYAMNWHDLDQDGDLDLVTASYDAALEKDLGNSFMLSDRAGVFVYENQDGFFARERLTNEAQGLAVFLRDLNDDGRTDILVGNDFAVQDEVWLQQPYGWEPSAPFETTTHSTMGFDSGDVNNDGRWELIATDMKPYATDQATLDQWQPVMDMMMHGEIEGDPQIMENVLQMQGDNGIFENQAADLGLDATGWSWSGKFGDLDHDGFLDLYVVNGMAASELFAQLPEYELVEENLAFRNDEGSGFVLATEWNLNAIEGGRGMSMADLDNDGDLDIIVNNLLAPAQIFENQLCQGESLQVDLFDLGSSNTRAIGAQVTLHTNNGRFTRDVRSNSGYLSGDPARLHFGFPSETMIEQLEVRWPDGTVSMVDDLSAGQLWRISRTQ